MWLNLVGTFRKYYDVVFYTIDFNKNPTTVLIYFLYIIKDSYLGPCVIYRELFTTEKLVVVVVVTIIEINEDDD